MLGIKVCDRGSRLPTAWCCIMQPFHNCITRFSKFLSILLGMDVQRAATRASAEKAICVVLSVFLSHSLQEAEFCCDRRCIAQSKSHRISPEDGCLLIGQPIRHCHQQLL